MRSIVGTYTVNPMMFYILQNNTRMAMYNNSEKNANLLLNELKDAPPEQVSWIFVSNPHMQHMEECDSNVKKSSSLMVTLHHTCLAFVSRHDDSSLFATIR